jgi:hypothetical protein
MISTSLAKRSYAKKRPVDAPAPEVKPETQVAGTA